MKRYAYVFFSTGRFANVSRLDRFYSWLIRFLSRSEFVHVAIGFDGAVLESLPSGCRYWPMLPFVEHYPSLTAAIRVPMDYAIDLDYFQDQVGVSWPAKIDTFWRFVRRGRGPLTKDCLCTVLLCLQAGGLPVPMTLTTPGELYCWLTQRYPHVRHAGSNTAFRFAARQLLID